MKRKTTKSAKTTDPRPGYDEFLAEMIALIENARSLIASTKPVKKQKVLSAPARVKKKSKAKPLSKSTKAS